MINLANRSADKEILDKDNIAFADIEQNMRELNLINTWLGGHGITIKGMQQLLQHCKTNQLITICEMGCGGGDNLQAINKWCTKKGIAVNFIGIDIKQECIDFAKQQYPDLPCQWMVKDYRDVWFDDMKPDIIFSSLFCHHFTNEQLLKMMQWMRRQSRTGFFINDLHRHWLAYYSIRLITRIFSSSYLVKNDAPLSVARGFKLCEWNSIFTGAAIKNYSISWKWAFRHLIVCIND
ncbi:methyltransferase domain-containing protein [Ferruginibacter paludis]|uniref:methyltransferase domain-containing protein n=1 Tax=Ferruginibacter paludis TaxID=1310417 RepID=UPI0025B43C7B|nr:methyltransferase domain-containing protein [Ferruginibacter paludis]MDN3654894.1 methyltransferase domain-containing protein [Ferruginibacter paludis]